MRYFKNIKNHYQKFDKFGNYFILTKKIERDLINENFDYEFELKYSGLVENVSYEENKEFICLLDSVGEFIMSNSNSMLKIYKPYLDDFNGEVLISGMGLGILILPLLNDDNVTKIDIVEKDLDIINYVYTNRIKNLDISNKINVINDDIFTFTTTNNYDYILLNHWVKPDDITLTEVSSLQSKFTNNLKENGTIRTPILDFY
jgi:hypothetical protein